MRTDSQAPGAGGFVRRRWCLWVAVGLVLLGAVLNAVYLFNHCPIDLSEDESHYWEWSRHLDYGYYSKPPGIAWVIWAAMRAGGWFGVGAGASGETLMPIVRMPAVLFGMLSGLLSAFFARRIFRDDRAALAVILLSAAVPMFAVGSLLITIDSPMYLCWAATVFCLWRAVEANSPARIGASKGAAGWLYAAGICSAAGMLFKPVLIAIPICAAFACAYDSVIRRAFKSIHALAALVIMLASQIPVILWNQQHGWVTFRHILTQGGLGAQAAAPARPMLQKLLLDPLSRLGEYVGGQAGGMAGLIFLLLVVAVVVAWKNARTPREQQQAADTPPTRSRWIFLLSFTLPLWTFYFLMNLWKGTEINWPAASYFTGMVLLAGVVTERWNAAPGLRLRRDWRGWTSMAVIVGLLGTILAMNLHRIYPPFAHQLEPLKGTPQYDRSPWNPRKWDPSARLRGLATRADIVESLRADFQKQTGHDPLIITSRYDTSSSLSFYLPDHPFVFCLMSELGGRMSQYDLWPGLNQKTDGRLTFAGKDALIIGVDSQGIDSVLRPAFDRVEGPEKLPVTYAGVTLKEVVVYRAFGFKGLAGSRSGVY